MRDALQREVFPKLREFCYQHGCRSQAIDLRWGVSEEAAVDQQTMNICLEEIRRSQEVTPRPNFIVLLGQRYGWRPLPAHIPAEEFEQILDRVSESQRGLLGQWYRRDDDAVPPECCLQPRTGEYEDGGRWAPTETKLHSILTDAMAGMEPTEEERVKYARSATEQEILGCILQADIDIERFTV